MATSVGMSLTGRAVLLSLFSCTVLGSDRGRDDCGSGSGEVLYRDAVVVGAGGTGTAAATFETKVGGATVRYVMVIRGCPHWRNPVEGKGHGPRSVASLKITLNGAVVFDTGSGCRLERLEVALNPVGGPGNTIDITATGSPGARTSVSVVAIRPRDEGAGHAGRACDTPPVAEAGPDQTLPPGAVVILDGSGSTDVDGDELTYAWSLESVPPGSLAALSDPAAVNPTFTIDAAGTYRVQLAVDDGTVGSVPDTVAISTENSPPVAHAGRDQSVLVGRLVTLDGSGSTDVDGDPLTHAWSLTIVPSRSVAALSDPSAVKPTFVADRRGTYVAQLVVADGTATSAPDTVSLSTANLAPVADPGLDQTVVAGQTVTLDGRGSSDADGDPLAFRWSFTTRPAGSTAVLVNETSAAPSFTADAPGTYVAQLIVSDGIVDSAPQTVRVLAANAPPTADAGPDQTVPPGATVQLDGSASTDSEGMPLVFLWSFTRKPPGSTAVLSDAASANPTFVADLPGLYIIELVVSDGRKPSAPDIVAVTATVAIAEFEEKVVAATGGTVTAGAATLSIPAGALSQDTTITVVTSSPNAGLPDGSSVQGLLFDLGPNGTTFSSPATLTLPLAGTPQPDEEAVISWLDASVGAWVDISSTVVGDRISAPVSHFTPYVVRFAPRPQLEIIGRWWSFYKMKAGALTEERLGPDSGNEISPQREKIGRGVLDVPQDYGPLNLFPPGKGPNADGQVYSNDDGRTYWASVEAPAPSAAEPDLIGSGAALAQSQWFRKTNAGARLQVIVTAATLEAIDTREDEPDQVECPWLQPNESVFLRCPRVMSATAWFDVSAFWYREQKDLLHTGGFAELKGWHDNWDIGDVYPSASSTSTFWTRSSFSLENDVDGDGGAHARMHLTAPIRVDVPLGELHVGDTFAVFVNTKVNATSRRLRRDDRDSYVSSFFRDPVETEGLGFTYEGLEPIESPGEVPAPSDPMPVPCTNGPDPAAGTLHFSATTYAEPEAPGNGAAIVVTRSGGSRGAVSVKLTTSDGTAVAGTHYTPVETQVLFVDGEEGSRAARVPILGDVLAGPNRTVNLTLSDPGGCAILDTPSSAVLTILDDDRPPVAPPGFTIGGTVTGLVGTGLILRNLGTNDLTPGNGPFTFSLAIPTGVPYNVTVGSQPTNPSQVCTVTNGSGTVGTANVTDVGVECVTSPANGALDPAFGSGGKVTGLVGGATAMALQSDGKIVVLGGRTLARYDAGGRLDTTFGTSGVVTVVFNGGVLDQAQGVALQPNGRIVVVGFTRVGASDDFAVARYDANGGPDLGFGTNGQVSTDFNNSVDKAWAVLIQGDGKIVVAGHASRSTPLGGDNDFAVARYTAVGVLDVDFGTGGKVTTNVGGRTDLAFAAALQPDGRILVTGRVSDDGVRADIGLVRYDGNGSPDVGFGSQGIVRSTLASFPSDIALQPDGKILVAVRALDAGARTIFGVVRFDGNGSPDGGFGAGGLATAAFSTQNDFPQAVAVQPDGKIVVAGQSSNLVGPDFALARFDTGGTLDPGFGTGGTLTVDFFGGSDSAEAVAVQADAKIVMAGLARNGASNNFGLARVNP